MILILKNHKEHLLSRDIFLVIYTAALAVYLAFFRLIEFPLVLEVSLIALFFMFLVAFERLMVTNYKSMVEEVVTTLEYWVKSQEKLRV